MFALRNLGDLAVAGGIVLLVLSTRHRGEVREFVSFRVVDRDARDSAATEQARDAAREPAAT
jgi:hypothetical protein